jgi:DNA invertase Pin-like site-specific DNA recombinase
VGYVRVSREKQGRSGLGLEAQDAALRRFAQTEGFEIVELFVEVESGKHDADKRPEAVTWALPFGAQIAFGSLYGL